MRQGVAATTGLGSVPKPKGVVVWRDEWLPASETFIFNQVAATRRWHPVPLGLRSQPAGLPISPARAPFGRSLPGRSALKIAAKMSFRFVYDSVIARENVKLIHAHFGPDAVNALPIARRLGLPLVATFHGFDVTSAPRWRGQVGAEYLAGLREVFAYAATLIAVSQFIADRLIDLGAPQERVIVAPIGIPVGSAQHHDLPALKRTGITFVGRLVDKKGVADLFQALTKLPRSTLINEPIRIIGYGPQEPYLRQMAADNKLSVEFLGQRDSTYVANALAQSRIFCGPSRTADNGDAEGFGMVFLEAALAGAPAIAYRHGGVPEAVVDGITGLLAPEGDIGRLAINISRLLQDSSYAISLGAAGRQRVIEHFDINHRTRRLEEIYDRVSAADGAS